MPQLSRDFDERKALVRGLINALIRNESIETTESKANAIRGLVDKLVSHAKKDDLHNRRMIQDFLEDDNNTDKLIKDLAPGMKSRAGGFLRVTKIGKRKGDNAMIVRVEFTEKGQKLIAQPKVVTSSSTPKKGKTAKQSKKDNDK